MMKTLRILHEYDLSLLSQLHPVRRNEDFIRFNRYISGSGDGHLYLLLFVWSGWQEGYQNPFFMAILIGFAIERPAYHILKNSFRCNRPESVLASAALSGRQTVSAFLRGILPRHLWLPCYAVIFTRCSFSGCSAGHF